MTSAYPRSAEEREEWIVAQRQGVARRELDPLRPYDFFIEEERSENGDCVPIATIFLTNRECPWRCLMCDLWRNTLPESVPAGAIPTQIDHALARLPPARQVKLYNSGSFFDQQAIPRQDDVAIAARVRRFERVIVESHPLLIGDRCWRLHDLVGGRLEVAMGLETVHPEVGPRLNKRLTPEQFARAARKLRAHGVALRVFVLAGLPFLDQDEALYWAGRSAEFALDCGAGVVTMIPTRTGNGALDTLAAAGDFAPPTLAQLEAATAHGVRLARGRVFADLWDLARFSNCSPCFDARVARLREMNLEQHVPPPVSCTGCGP